MGRVLVGTSGYMYREWRGILYPPKLAAKRWLPHYARFFPTLELNNTFYRLPNIDAVDGWRQQTADDFVFVAKGSRFLTHMKRLLDVDQGPRRFFERVDHLRHKLAVVLWQLPP